MKTVLNILFLFVSLAATSPVWTAEVKNGFLLENPLVPVEMIQSGGFIDAELRRRAAARNK